jgi:hypothetical protein
VRSPSAQRRDPLAAALAALCALDLLLIGLRLTVSDLNLDYPFMDGDSWDWIANGLRLAGADVRSSGRPPLLPAVIALLDRLSALPWLPVLLQALFLATVLAFFGLASRLAGRRAAFAAALALLLSHSLRGMSVQIMADVPASCLLFLAVRFFLLAEMETRPRSYLASGAWGAASALAQPAALLALLPAGVTVLARRRRDLRSLWLAAGIALFLGVPALAAAAQRLLAAPGDPVILHSRLLHLGGESIPFYLWSLAALLGLPGALLLAAGLVLAVRRAPGDGTHLFLVLLVSLLLGFFIFLYGFNAERFLVYLVWPAGLLIAEALGRLRRAPFLIAAILLVAGAALPLPGAGNDPAWIGLWPLPPVYAHTGLTGEASGSPHLDLSGLSIARFPAMDLLRFSIPRRVWSPRPPAPAGRLSPAELAADRGALFLAADPADGGGRYRILTRLGNALRRRVKFVSADWLYPSLHRLGVSPVGTIGPDYAVFRAHLPGLSGTWLLVASAGGPVRPRLDEVAGSVAAPFDPELRDGLAQALEIDARLTGGDQNGRNDRNVALLPAATAADPRRFYLPFLLRTTELYIVDPVDGREVRALLATAPQLGADRIGATTVHRIVYLGRPAAIVDLGPFRGTAAPPR